MLASVFCELSTVRSEHGAARRPLSGQLRQDPSLVWQLYGNNAAAFEGGFFTGGYSNRCRCCIMRYSVRCTLYLFD